MPISFTHSSARSGSRSRRTPRAFSTSALPEREETARLPCLATVIPAPATTNATAVDTLKVAPPSPPVPQVSTTTGSVAWMRTALARMARAEPVISSTVSPFMRSAVT